MDLESIFNKTDTDAIFCASVMDVLGVTSDDFIDPKRYNQFLEVVKYLKESPNWEYIAKKLTHGKMDDKLKLVWEYSQLEGQLKMTQEEKTKMKENLDVVTKFASDKNLNLGDLQNYANARSQYDNVEKKIANIESEMKIYEN